MQVYRDDGVVLRTQKLGEADRIITLLCRQNGRIRAVAKGVRRTKSRFGARLEPFTHVDLMIHPGRTLDVITQAEVIRAYGPPLAADYPKYTAGVAMLETAERLTPAEKEPAIRQFLLLIGGLRALGEAAGPSSGRPVSLRMTAAMGSPSQPSMPNETPGSCSTPTSCGRSRSRGTRPRWRSAPAAGLAAPSLAARDMRRSRSGPGAWSASRAGRRARPRRAPETIALMQALLRGDWDSAMRSERRQRVECSGLVAAYLQWHLEHSIRSLRHVERA